MTYKVVFSKTYDQNQVDISYRPTTIHRNKDALDHIKKQWNKSVKENPTMFAGSLVNIQKNKSDAEHIRLDTTHSTYDDFFVTRTKEFQRKFPNENKSNILSVGGILVTEDNWIVLGIRNKELVIEPGKTTIVSGMVDDRDIRDFRHVDIFGCIKREIEEEIGIRDHQIHNLVAIGLVQNHERNNTYIPFFGRISMPFEKILEIENDGEFAQLNKIKNFEKQIQIMIKENDNLSDIIVPSFQIYLKLFSILNKK